MKLLIEIPQEFEGHYFHDGFDDSLERLKHDAHLIAGNYEKELVDMLIDAFQRAQIYIDLSPQWIPVTERLPEEDGWYQVFAPDYSGGSSSGLKNIKGNMYSAFKHGKWSIEVGYHKRPGCVKAWMYLPEPPKEIEDEQP